MDFFDLLTEFLSMSETENGALGYKTTNSALLDMNFKISSYRNCKTSEIQADFEKAFKESPKLAIVWAFFVRDIREGVGERRLFREIMKCLSNIHPEYTKKVLSLIPEYGRWDDLTNMLGIWDETNESIISIIREQLKKDLESDSPSLIAKWLPSENTSSQETKNKAKTLREALGITPREYRKILSALRTKLKIVERDMSANRWQEINYSHVPSRANLIYNKAFFKHDEQRREEFLNSVNRGEQKINASTLFPHDIIYRLRNGENDSNCEAMWKNLPPPEKMEETTLVVRDGSGSMREKIHGSGVEAIDVSTALAIYFSQYLPPPYKDIFITFSHNPELVDLSKCNSLLTKYEVCKQYNDYTNTNIEKVFDLILSIAINNCLPQEQIPKNILIISDMEFDKQMDGSSHRLFEKIAKSYKCCGYKLPKLIFWNVCSRTNTILITQNENGVILLSGFSQNAINMAMTGELDPYKAMLKILYSDRYKPIRTALAM